MSYDQLYWAVGFASVTAALLTTLVISLFFVRGLSYAKCWLALLTLCVAAWGMLYSSAPFMYFDEYWLSPRWLDTTRELLIGFSCLAASGLGYTVLAVVYRLLERRAEEIRFHAEADAAMSQLEELECDVRIIRIDLVELDADMDAADELMASQPLELDWWGDEIPAGHKPTSDTTPVGLARINAEGGYSLGYEMFRSKAGSHIPWTVVTVAG